MSAGMFMHGLTWRGRGAAIYYRLRRFVVQPASAADRCVMGSTVDPMVHCPRRAPGDLWCRHHQPKPLSTFARPISGDSGASRTPTGDPQ